jgi:hypothetical protein
MHNAIEALGAIGFGLLLAIHCPRAAVREFRNGIAEGGHGTYSRISNPIAFWVVIATTFAAGIMGVFFVLFGIVLAIYGL